MVEDFEDFEDSNLRIFFLRIFFEDFEDFLNFPKRCQSGCIKVNRDDDT